MNNTSRRVASLVSLVLGTGLITVPPVDAAVWAEVGDAGELTSSAQQITGSGLLTQITGELTSGSDRDIYKVNITDPANFSFTVSATGQAGGFADTVLALFNSSGVGLIYQDDIDHDGGNLRSSLVVSGGNFTIGPAGSYYLAIVGWGTQNRFIDQNSQPLWQDEPSNIQRAPDGTGAGNSFVAYSGPGGVFVGTYTIDITGGVSPVPEPACYGIIFGIMGVAVASLHYYRNSGKTVTNPASSR